MQIRPSSACEMSTLKFLSLAEASGDADLSITDEGRVCRCLYALWYANRGW